MDILRRWLVTYTILESNPDTGETRSDFCTTIVGVDHLLGPEYLQQRLERYHRNKKVRVVSVRPIVGLPLPDEKEGDNVWCDFAGTIDKWWVEDENIFRTNVRYEHTVRNLLEEAELPTENFLKTVHKAAKEKLVSTLVEFWKNEVLPAVTVALKENKK